MRTVSRTFSCAGGSCAATSRRHWQSLRSLSKANTKRGFVEHAYIEPEAGFARRVGDTVEIQACTQSPYMDRNDIAKILGISPEQVRIIPTAVGGGFRIKTRSVSAAVHCPGGVEIGSHGAHGVFANGIDYLDDEAASFTD